MENLPFLKQSDREPPSRNAPSESDWPREHQRYVPQQEDVAMVAPPRPDVFESLKANPMALVLLGIVIGALLVNMRPVVIKN